VPLGWDDLVTVGICAPALLVVIIRLMARAPGLSGRGNMLSIPFRSQNGAGHRNRSRVVVVCRGPGCIDGMGGFRIPVTDMCLPKPRSVES
jgi:hypothetical protein